MPTKVQLETENRLLWKAMITVDAMFSDAIDVLTDHLTYEISEEECIDRLLNIFDGPEQRRARELVDRALSIGEREGAE